MERPPFLTRLAGAFCGLYWWTFDLGVQSRQPEIRRLISSAQATVTGTLDDSDHTRNVAWLILKILAMSG
jgi:hypothetical protein